MRLSGNRETDSVTDMPVTEDNNFQTVKVIDDIEDLYGNEKLWYAKGQTWITVVILASAIGLALFFWRKNQNKRKYENPSPY